MRKFVAFMVRRNTKSSIHFTVVATSLTGAVDIAKKTLPDWTLLTVSSSIIKKRKENNEY
jgi:hypothetical protein